jgi:hypothetical protein
MDIKKERLIKQCQIALGEFDEDFIYEDVDFSTPSSIKRAYEIYERLNEKKIAGLVKKSEKSGISYGILKQVYNRGMAAWKTGHRPGTTPQQWAFARVNSFITGGKTRTTADKDLWAKHKGKKESLEELKEPFVVFNKKTKEVLATGSNSRSLFARRGSYARDNKVDVKDLEFKKVSKKQSVGSILKEDAKCPSATQDLEVNTTNRDATIKKFNYGPLNVDEPGSYWKDIAKYWKTTEEAAKKSLCENCVAFDISPRMKDCMPGKTTDKDGELGYCWMHHFKCHSARSCHTWAKGGPIVGDDVSYDWQKRSKI